MSLIGIFSDVHGNLPALHAVLEDITNRNVDQVFCLGDLVDFAPWTNEVIELIRDQHIPCIMGNHDERIAYDMPVIPLAKHSPEEAAARLKAIDTTRRTILPGNKKYLKELPRQILLSFKMHDKDFNVQLVHGSNRSNSEYVYEDHDPVDVYSMTKDYHANILVVGHTHLSYIRKLPPGTHSGGHYVMNCGSVGRSREDRRRAAYLLLDITPVTIHAEIIKLLYPVEETVAAIRQSDIPDFYANFFNS